MEVVNIPSDILCYSLKISSKEKKKSKIAIFNEHPLPYKLFILKGIFIKYIRTPAYIWKTEFSLKS